jgi:hypothetical protein
MKKLLELVVCRRMRRLAVLAGAQIALLAACSSSASGRSAGASPAVSESTHANARTAVVTVPMRVISHGPATMELVPVYIAGHGPYIFMLDTGSSISSISRQLATQLGLRRTGITTQIRGVATTTRVPLAAIPSWKLGKALLAPETVAVLDLSKTSGGKVAGLLGSDELRHFGTVTINFPRQQLQLAQP